MNNIIYSLHFQAKEGGIMLDIIYRNVEKDDISNLFDEHINMLSGNYDNFMVKKIFDSIFYSIEFEGVLIGYYAVNEDVITQYYIIRNYVFIAARVLVDILEEKKLEYIFVPTFNEFLLSLLVEFSIEYDIERHVFSDSTRLVLEPSYSKRYLRMANLSDFSAITKASDDFIKDLEQRILKREVYLLEDDEIMGIGFIEDNKLFEYCKRIGVYTATKYRHKDVARSLIIHLKDMVHALDYLPFPSCSKNNIYARKAFEGAGFIKTSTILKIKVR